LYHWHSSHTVNPCGNHLYSLCLTNCSNGYFSFDHAYRIIQASIAFLYKVTKCSFNLVFHVRPSYVLKRTKLNRLPLPIQAFEYIHYYTSLLIKMKTEAQIVCSHTETNEELLEWWRHCRRTIRHRRSNVSNCEWWCAGTQLSIV
jgi:hypothetical protein